MIIVIKHAASHHNKQFYHKDSHPHHTVLPKILAQIEECNDKLAQGYLMDCVVQVWFIIQSSTFTQSPRTCAFIVSIT